MKKHDNDKKYPRLEKRGYNQVTGIPALSYIVSFPMNLTCAQIHQGWTPGPPRGATA